MKNSAGSFLHLTIILVFMSCGGCPDSSKKKFEGELFFLEKRQMDIRSPSLVLCRLTNKKNETKIIIK